MPLTLMAPPPPPTEKGSKEAKLITKHKRYHRKEKKPVPPKEKPKKARLPNGRYFHKVEWKSLKKIKKAKKREGRKKLRGANKKAHANAVRMYRTMNTWGEPMASKPAPDYRSIIFPGDICNLMHLDPRPASRYLTRIRKRLGKPRGEIITLKEFCSVTPWTEEEVIPYLR